jgi:hypothetical protein
MELTVHDTQKIDFFKKRETKERDLERALARLEEHKSKSVETLYPAEIYAGMGNPRMLYYFEYMKLLEDALRAKTSLEVMDMVFEGTVMERISIMEDFVKNKLA